MLRIKTVVGTSVVGAALLATGVTGVFAHGGPGSFGGRGGGSGFVGFGKLASISASSVTVTTPSNGTLTATLASQATYTALSQAAALAGLKTGDQVAVRGSSVNGANTVRSVEYDTKVFVAASVRYTGTITSSSATSLTLKTTSGQPVTVQLNSSTVYAVNNAKASSRPTFAANQAVRVSAVQYTDGSLVARIVSVTTS